MKKILKWTAIGLVIAIALGVLGILGLMTWTYAEEVSTDITNKINSVVIKNKTLTTDTYYKLNDYTMLEINGDSVIEYKLNIVKDDLDYLNKGYSLGVYDKDKTLLESSNMTKVTAEDKFNLDIDAYVCELDFGMLLYHVEFDEETGAFVESDKVSLLVYTDLCTDFENIKYLQITEIVEEDPLPSPAPEETEE